MNQIFIQQFDLCGNNFKIPIILHKFGSNKYQISQKRGNMQNSMNFEIIATEIELLNKYLIQ
jgi:hypothetical protein